MSYEPPFTISHEMVALISDISEKLGQISHYKNFESKPTLRHNNRIRSIYASLAIEANSLSLDEVRGVVGGKTVLGPAKEIQEVKDAYEAYGLLGRFDPYSLAALLRLHGIMTKGTVSESGAFRQGEEGVFRGDQCIFMAPPARRVPTLMGDLFDWIGAVKRRVHPLILSSVFHYEFVFIHPFADGNGRMARLWQTALLAQWHPVFQYMPLESRVHAFQEEYYEAIAACNSAGNADAFILFMLEKIAETVELVLRQANANDEAISPYVKRLLDAMEYGVPYTASQIMALLGLKSKETLRKHYLNPAIEAGLVRMSVPDKPTSRRQTYVRE